MSVEDILALEDDGNEGCVVECDLDYPAELHPLHDDYPLAPETLTVQKDWLSPYQHGLMEKLDSSSLNVCKLVPNLRGKGAVSTVYFVFAYIFLKVIMS